MSSSFDSVNIFPGVGGSTPGVPSARTVRRARDAGAPPADGPTTHIDLSRSQVTDARGTRALSFRSSALLIELISARGEVVDRDRLIDALWLAHGLPSPGPRAVDMLIRRVRATIGAGDGVIGTVRGLGYRFAERPEVRVTLP